MVELSRSSPNSYVSVSARIDIFSDMIKSQIDAVFFPRDLAFHNPKFDLKMVFSVD